MNLIASDYKLDIKLHKSHGNTKMYSVASSDYILSGKDIGISDGV